MKALPTIAALLVTIVGPATAADSNDLERNEALVKQFFAAVEGRDKTTVLKLVGTSLTSETCVTFHLSLEFTTDRRHGKSSTPNVLFSICFPPAAQLLHTRSI